MIKLPVETAAANEDLTGRISYMANKTIKILTGQSNKPMPNSQNQQQMSGPGYYPNYPQSPSQGDLSGQGSGPQPNYQAGRPQQSSESPEGVPEAYLQIIAAIEKLVGRMDKIDSRLSTIENIVYHITTNKKEEPQKG
jgi:hypothetical protein